MLQRPQWLEFICKAYDTRTVGFLAAPEVCVLSVRQALRRGEETFCTAVFLFYLNHPQLRGVLIRACEPYWCSFPSLPNVAHPQGAKKVWRDLVDGEVGPSNPSLLTDLAPQYAASLAALVIFRGLVHIQRCSGVLVLDVMPFELSCPCEFVYI